jgi:hypothetical protein
MPVLEGLTRRLIRATVGASLALVTLAASGGIANATSPASIGAVAFQKKQTKAQTFELTDYRLAHRSRAEHGRVNVSWRAIDNTLPRGLPNLPARRDGRACTTPLYAWCVLNRVLGGYAAIDLPVNPVLIGTPGWANTRGCNAGGSANACHPAAHAMPEWRAFVTRAVQRYGPNGIFWNHLRAPAAMDMQVWEVWNEPNLHMFWDGTRADPVSEDAQQYAQLVNVTAAAVDLGARSRGRTAQVAGPSVSAFKPGAPGEWLNTFATTKAQSRLDLVSGHLYGRTADKVIAQVDRYRELLPNRPMWITENGFGSESGCQHCVGSARAQRAEFGRLMDRLGDREYVDSFTWFMGARHPSFRGSHGLYRDNGSAKPIVKTFQARAADRR